MTVATMTPSRHEARRQLPIVLRIQALASEFDNAARWYSEFDGSHSALLADESKRIAAQLRCVATFIINDIYDQEQGMDWLRAGARIINAIARSNLK